MAKENYNDACFHAAVHVVMMTSSHWNICALLALFDGNLPVIGGVTLVIYLII